MASTMKISVLVTLACLASSVASDESETSSGLVALKPVLKDHSISYTDPLHVRSDYKSEAEFDPRGMHHVYAITHFFLDLIQRDQVIMARSRLDNFKLIESTMILLRLFFTLNNSKLKKENEMSRFPEKKY